MNPRPKGPKTDLCHQICYHLKRAPCNIFGETVSSMSQLAALPDDAQQLADAPCLRRTSTRRVRFGRVEDLRNLAHPGFSEVSGESGNSTFYGLIRIHPADGVDIAADEPAPNGSLVVGRISIEG